MLFLLAKEFVYFNFPASRISEMKRNFHIFCLVLVVAVLCSVAAFAQTSITSPLQIGFQPVKDNIVLRWRGVDESMVKQYLIERSTDQINYSVIETVTPRGNNTDYSYTDTNIFKTAARTFYYRLRIQNKDSTISYSNIVHLSPRISSAKQTWGCIKAIFTNRKKN